MPDVFAVARMSDDASPIVVGVCPDCAKQSDAQIYSIMRRQFQRRGIGAEDAGHTKVVLEVKNVAEFEAIPGVRIAVALPDGLQTPFDCEVAVVLKRAREERNAARH